MSTSLRTLLDRRRPYGTYDILQHGAGSRGGRLQSAAGSTARCAGSRTLSGMHQPAPRSPSLSALASCLDAALGELRIAHQLLKNFAAPLSQHAAPVTTVVAAAVASAAGGTMASAAAGRLARRAVQHIKSSAGTTGDCALEGGLFTRHSLRSVPSNRPSPFLRCCSILGNLTPALMRTGHTAAARVAHAAPKPMARMLRAGHTAAAARVVGGAWPPPGGLQPHQLRVLRWTRPREYLHYVNQLLSDAVAPYWNSASWGSFGALYRQTSTWLPLVPRARAQAYMFTINALNAVGSNLPRLLVFTVAELTRGNSRAQAFEYFVDMPQTDVATNYPWYATAIVSMITTATNCFKVMWLLLIFSPVLLMAPLALGWNIGRHDWFVLLRQTLEFGGPAFIKWGQWAATRQDLFPPDMCKQLGLLQTQAPGHSFKFTRRTIDEAFGISLTELFDKFETEPMASGSIGQIHKAVLSHKGALITGFPAGTAVAVKVRHPGVGEAILRDFKTMTWVASLANKLPALQHLQLEETLKQFAAPLQEQVDLSREAGNLRQFNHNFRRAHDVLFPVPLYPLVTCDVLVETFQEGDHITNYIAADQNPYNHRLAELGSGLMLQMMLMDNLIHSDLHPGNILVRLEPPRGLLGLAYRCLDIVRHSDRVNSTTKAEIVKTQSGWLQPKMILLDVGMTTELTPLDQVNMVGLFRSFAAMDGEAVADWTMAFSGEHQTCPNPEAFRLGMVHTFDVLKNQAQYNVRRDSGASEFSSSAEALSAVLEMVRQHKVSLPGHICAVVVTTLVLEGWSNKLDSEHSVLSTVQQMFQEHIPWRLRVVDVVDKVMDDEDNHLVLQ